VINKQNKQLSRFKTTTIIRSPLADDDVNKLLRGCCVDAFISECALPKKRRKQKQQICFEWRIFFKNNNKFREENVFKTMKIERNEENNIRLLYTTLG